jgi:hypothetical protein
MTSRSHAAILIGAAALATVLSACMLSPSEQAANHGLPAQPFTDMVLQVVDASRAESPSTLVQFYWTLTLSDPLWADYLSSTIFVMPPDDTVGPSMDDVVLLTDKTGANVGVLGLWHSEKTSTVGFGDYRISSFGIFKQGDSDPPEYVQTFTAKNPDGAASGTCYTDMASGTPKLADVAAFKLTMYQDGLGITLASGTLPRADGVVLDFYKSASSSSPIAELSLSAAMITALKSGTTIVVKPDTLAALYSANSVTSSSAGWYVVYCTVDSPEASLATRTEYLYLSYSDATTNSSGTAAPTGYTSFPITASSIAPAPHAAAGGPAQFRASADGIRPYLPRTLRDR